MSDLKHLARSFKEDHDVLFYWSAEQLATFLEHASNLYYNTKKEIMTDDEYDLARERLAELEPKHPYLRVVGAAAPDQSKAKKLPLWMGSLDKLKDAKKLIQWLKNHTGIIVLMPKLDGASVLLYKDKGKAKLQLFTRGKDGVGQNISPLIPLLFSADQIETLESLKETIAIRAEILIKSENYGYFDINLEYDNPRAIASGILHDDDANIEKVKHLTFAAYELCPPAGSVGDKTISEQLQELEHLGFEVVRHEKQAAELVTLEYLTKRLAKWRRKSPYQMDGLVLFHDTPYEIVWGKRHRSYAVAFKDSTAMEKKQVTVLGIEWNCGKDGYLKPTVVYEPVQLGGTTCQRANAHNARYVEDSGIGPGAELIVFRSGDVNPQVASVVSASPQGASMPPVDSYEWIESGAEIRALGPMSNGQITSQLVHFCRTMRIKGAKVGKISKLVEAGVVMSLLDLWNLKERKVRKLEGFGATSAENLVSAITAAKEERNLSRLMAATNIFGRGSGEEVLTLICNMLPRKKKKALAITEEELAEIEGIGPKRAASFVRCLPDFLEFLSEVGLTLEDFPSTVVNKNEGVLGEMSGQVIVFTGFRKEQWEELIKAQGGSVVGKVSGKVKIVVAKDPDRETASIVKGRELGAEILSMEAFEKRYINKYLHK